MGRSELSGHDVARELRRRVPSAGVLKIQKLLYYCDGWNIAFNGRPLFQERIEAWDQGPVVADVWHDEHRGRELPPQRSLAGADLAIVEYVVKRYGHFTGEELMEMTHREDPWRSLTNERGEVSTRNAEITPDAMRGWFTHDDEYLAHAAEVARMRERRDVYAFEDPAITPSLKAACEHVLGQPVVDAHPA